MNLHNQKHTQKTFEPWMLDAVKDHLIQGGSMRSLSGVLGINPGIWGNMVKTIPELVELNQIYKRRVNEKQKFKANTYG